MVTVEQATVYRGGGRRWLTRKAALHAEAKAIHRKRFKPMCDCCDGEFDSMSGMPLSPGETCRFHEASFYNRFVRRVMRLLAGVNHG